MFYKHTLLTVLLVHIFVKKPTKDVINILHFLPTVSHESQECNLKLTLNFVILCDKPRITIMKVMYECKMSH